uniref:Cadherin domain-containing protein n=1 Tax=Xiphophorus couchianus TaxID=32473 RepID=A0A3B5L663_9TELE
MISADAKEKGLKTLKRAKREWILPPAKLKENHNYTHLEFIAKIRSDRDKQRRVEYSLTGAGADKPPFNLFVVDHNTGFIRITDILDREKYPSYNLTGIAKFKDGISAEENIPLTVTVLDENDNPPYFVLHKGNVTEASREGTFVMQIEGKDDDEAGTINSEIVYTIISQEPAGKGHMFTIDKKTGKLFVKESTLDREAYDFYKLVVKGTDMGGAPSGKTGTGTVEIKVTDINDNIPTLEKSEYAGSVDENVADVVVMRIKALDKDLLHTNNWLTVFTIAQGNEDNLFSIETDKETNEGILKLIKPVDFEEVQNLELGLIIENVAPFVEGGPIKMDVDVQVGEGGPLAAGAAAGAGAGVGVGVGAGVDLGVDLGYPIKIAVNNVPEGPAFRPDTKKVPVSEDPNEAPADGVITSFPAVDPDTGKVADDVSYAKAYDPDNWFTVDEETAEIKLNKQPDRESPFLVNGTYIAKILAISKDMPAKTATGTIAIQVTDSNDHCPTLTTTYTSLCSDKKTVYVTAFDEDVSPNAAPFTFQIIPEGTRGNWEIEVINDTTAALHSAKALWPGRYELQVEVKDAQGLSCKEERVFTVDVCTCVGKEDCRSKASRGEARSSDFSRRAIGPIVTALFLLMLIPLLLVFCQCGGANTIFSDQFSDLPFDTKEHLINYHTECIGEDKVYLLNKYTYLRTLSVILVLFLFPKQKSTITVPSEDILLEYDFEGKGSSAGSVGSCSILEPDNDLNFLTDLGPKFRTLAEICSPPTLTSKAMVIQKASGSVKTTTDITEPVFKPKFNYEIQAKHVDDKAEKVVSSAKVVQSHVSTTTKESTTKQLTTTTLPHSTSTNISHSAKLSYPAQTVVLQQPPVYYTASPVLQPMHYIVQPNVQNTFVLEDGTHANTFPGLYVINDPKSMSGLVYGRTQSSLSGLVIQDTEGPKSPISPVSPTGSLRTTVLLPSPTFSQGCVEGSTLYGQNLGGNYVLLKDEVQEWGPGSPQGILPGDAILVKKAAPPQGVLGLAAQENVCISSFCYFLVKKANGGGGVIVTGGISFGSFSVLKYLTKQQRMWIWLNKVKVD